MRVDPEVRLGVIFGAAGVAPDIPARVRAEVFST